MNELTMGEARPEPMPPLTLDLPGLEVTPVGVNLANSTPGAVTPDRMLAACQHLHRRIDVDRWVLGDLAIAIAATEGEPAMARQMAAIGMDQVELQKAYSVAVAVPYSVRRPGLSWSHHNEVRNLDPPSQDRWLRCAEEGDGQGKPWPVRALRHAIADAAREGQPELPGMRPDGWVGRWPPSPPESSLMAALAGGHTDDPVLWLPAAGGLARARVRAVDAKPGRMTVVVVEVDPELAAQLPVDEPGEAA